MILARLIRDLFRSRIAETRLPPVVEAASLRSVLNVGGGSKEIPIPEHYRDWRQLLLDIDSKGKPDIVSDARELTSLAAERFDAVYCSHNLEHYFKHDGVRVLRGFLHVLKATGFAEIRVPDLHCVIRHVVEKRMEIEDILYVSPGGPISVRDVIYGWGRQIELSGVDFYAHKTGFTAKSLLATLEAAGFARVFVQEKPDAFEIRAVAFKAEPSPPDLALLGVQ